MNLSTDTNSLRLFGQVFDSRSAVTPMIDYYTQKPNALLPLKNEQPLDRCAPESVGVSSSLLLDYYTDLQKTLTQTGLHSVMVLKDNKVIFESNFGPYSRHIPNACYSFSKTVAATAVGMLIDDGVLSLDDRAIELLGCENLVSPFSKANKVTVRHLLNMTSGATLIENGAVLSENWVETFFTSSFKTEPGKVFNYNSMNTYILSAIVCKVTGESLSAFLEKRLFSKLGITNYFWEKNTQGIEKGGWGLYLCTEDMAKMALFYLNKGNWNGEQLLSEHFCTEACTKQITTTSSNGGYDYGFHIWPRKEDASFVFSGLFGQYAMVYPHSNIAVVCTASGASLFQDTTFIHVTNKYFANELDKTPSSLSHRLKLRKLCSKADNLIFDDSRKTKKFSLKSFFIPAHSKQFLNREFSFSLSDKNGVGVLPLLLQMLQNNYTCGIKTADFKKEGSCVLCHFTESDGAEYRFTAGIGKYVTSTLRFKNEQYLVASCCGFTTNEDDVPVMKLKMCFLETASERTFKFILEEDGYTVKIIETPGEAFVGSLLSEASEKIESIPGIRNIAGPILEHLPGMVFHSAFCPTFKASAK